MNEIVAVGTIHASVLPVVFVLLATIATSSFHIYETWTLSASIALQLLRADVVTIASFAAFPAEPILVRKAGVTMLASDTRPTLALTSDRLASTIIRSLGVTITRCASLSTEYVVIPFFALVTISTDYVRLALAVPCQLFTRCHPAIVKFERARRITLAQLASVLFTVRQSISVVSWETFLAMKASRAIHALQTFASLVIAVSNSVQVDVVITIARSAGYTLLRASKVSVRACFTPMPCSTQRALGANRIWIIAKQYTRPIVGAGARFTVIRGALQRMAIISSCTQFAIATSRIVLANALPCFGFANFRMAVAIARDTEGEGATVRRVMVKPWRA